MQLSKHIVIISGGTASNSLVNLFQSLSDEISYILPISDNGGSTSEIVRVLGGPAIGDLRSRITRLIPDEGFRNLLSYRLSEDSAEAKSEWTAIVEGNHLVWKDIQPSCKEMIRSFLIHVHMELLKKSRNPITNFRFELASVGNLLLTGVRLFVGSLDSSIELVLRIARVSSAIQILPCLNTNYTYNISALLENGEKITGQSQISHPHEEFPTSSASSKFYDDSMEKILLTPRHEDEDIPYQHPDLRISQLKFSKSENVPLKSPIERIFYINPYGEEIHPVANSRTVNTLKNSDAIIYSIGSLMTSTLPILILKGIGEAIKSSSAQKKILLLNGCHDRETLDMDAIGFIKKIYESISYSTHDNDSSFKITDVLTHLIHLKNSEITVDAKQIANCGIVCVEVKNEQDLGEQVSFYDPDDLQEKLDAIINPH